MHVYMHTILSLDQYNAFTHTGQEHKNALNRLMNALVNLQIIEEQAFTVNEKPPTDHKCKQLYCSVEKHLSVNEILT